MAKMKKCKHCDAEIAPNAKRCPKCGGKLGMPTGLKIVIIIVIIFVCMIGCVNSCGKSLEETSNSYADINGKTSFKLNETFQNTYTKITMTEVSTDFKDYSEYQEPTSGYKYIMAKFEIENIDEKSDEQYISSLNFNAYADGIAVESKYIVNDIYKDISATLGKGKKTIGYVFYEVPINSTEITIEYSTDFWTDGNNIEFVVQ